MTNEPKSQSDKFTNAARELGADEDEQRWEERLKRLARPQPSETRRARVGKAPKPFEFHLTQAEADEINNAAGEGGHQSLHRKLVDQLKNGNVIYLDDAGLGEVIRYMTQYKGGGFQGRLRNAFERSLKEQLGF